MTVNILRKKDDCLRAIARALNSYAKQHPEAKIELYRQNSVSVRIRIIDPNFSESSKADRHDNVWKFFEKLPYAIQSQIIVLLLLTPKETSESIANLDFDHPVPSQL